MAVVVECKPTEGFEIAKDNSHRATNTGTGEAEPNQKLKFLPVNLNLSLKLSPRPYWNSAYEEFLAD